MMPENQTVRSRVLDPSEINNDVNGFNVMGCEPSYQDITLYLVFPNIAYGFLGNICARSYQLDETGNVTAESSTSMSYLTPETARTYSHAGASARFQGIDPRVVRMTDMFFVAYGSGMRRAMFVASAPLNSTCGTSALALNTDLIVPLLFPVSSPPVTYVKDLMRSWDAMRLQTQLFNCALQVLLADTGDDVAANALTAEIFRAASVTVALPNAATIGHPVSLEQWTSKPPLTSVMQRVEYPLMFSELRNYLLRIKEEGSYELLFTNPAALLLTSCGGNKEGRRFVYSKSFSDSVLNSLTIEGWANPPIAQGFVTNIVGGYDDLFGTSYNEDLFTLATDAEIEGVILGNGTDSYTAVDIMLRAQQRLPVLFPSSEFAPTDSIYIWGDSGTFQQISTGQYLVTYRSPLASAGELLYAMSHGEAKAFIPFNALYLFPMVAATSSQGSPTVPLTLTATDDRYQLLNYLYNLDDIDSSLLSQLTDIYAPLSQFVDTVHSISEAAVDLVTAAQAVIVEVQNEIVNGGDSEALQEVLTSALGIKEMADNIHTQSDELYTRVTSGEGASFYTIPSNPARDYILSVFDETRQQARLAHLRDTVRFNVNPILVLVRPYPDLNSIQTLMRDEDMLPVARFDYTQAHATTIHLACMELVQIEEQIRAALMPAANSDAIVSLLKNVLYREGFDHLAVAVGTYLNMVRECTAYPYLAGEFADLEGTITPSFVGHRVVVAPGCTTRALGNGASELESTAFAEIAETATGSTCPLLMTAPGEDALEVVDYLTPINRVGTFSFITADLPSADGNVIADNPAYEVFQSASHNRQWRETIIPMQYKPVIQGYVSKQIVNSIIPPESPSVKQAAKGAKARSAAVTQTDLSETGYNNMSMVAPVTVSSQGIVSATSLMRLFSGTTGAFSGKTGQALRELATMLPRMCVSVKNLFNSTLIRINPDTQTFVDQIWPSIELDYSTHITADGSSPLAGVEALHWYLTKRSSEESAEFGYGLNGIQDVLESVLSDLTGTSCVQDSVRESALRAVPALDSALSLMIYARNRLIVREESTTKFAVVTPGVTSDISYRCTIADDEEEEVLLRGRGLRFYNLCKTYFVAVSALDLLITATARTIILLNSVGADYMPFGIKPTTLTGVKVPFKVHSFVGEDGNPVYPKMGVSSIALTEANFGNFSLNEIRRGFPEGSLYYDLKFSVDVGSASGGMKQVPLVGLGLPDADYAGYGTTIQSGTFVVDTTLENTFATRLIDIEVIDSLEELREAFVGIQEGFSKYDFLMRSDTNLKYPTVSGTSVTVNDLSTTSEVPTSSLLAAHSQELPEIRRVEITGKIDSTYVFPYHTSYDYYSNLAASVNVGFNSWLPSAINPELTLSVIKVDPANSTLDQSPIEAWILNNSSTTPMQKYARDTTESAIFADSTRARREINAAAGRLLAGISQKGFIKVLSEMSESVSNRFFIPVIGATAPSSGTESFLLAITLKHALEYSNNTEIDQVSDDFVTQLCIHAASFDTSNPWNKPTELTSNFGRGDTSVTYNINLAKRRAFIIAYLLGVSLFRGSNNNVSDDAWTRYLDSSLEGKKAHLIWYRKGPLPSVSSGMNRVQLFRCFGVGSMFCDDRGQGSSEYLDSQRHVAIDFTMTRTVDGLAFNTSIDVPGTGGPCDGIKAQLSWNPEPSRISTADVTLGLSRDPQYRNSYIPLVTQEGEVYTVSRDQHFTPLKPLTHALENTDIRSVVGGNVTEDMLKRFLADRGRARRAMDDVARVAGANFEKLFGITTGENILDRLVIEVEQ
jgi:hypothetical protein